MLNYIAPKGLQFPEMNEVLWVSSSVFLLAKAIFLSVTLEGLLNQMTENKPVLCSMRRKWQPGKVRDGPTEWRT